MTVILDGKKLSNAILENLKARASKIDITPGLCFIIVGNHSASHIYVSKKREACSLVGITSYVEEIPENTTTNELKKIISSCNDNSDIHGIIVQQPLPAHINVNEIINTITPAKDVDGFHPENLGKLCYSDASGHIPCTPFGILRLLDEYNIELEGKHVVIVGRSNIVGKPLSILLLQKSKLKNATVSVIHSKTKNPESLLLKADVVITALGVPKYLKKDMIKKGSIVIDVGITRLDNGTLCGDADFDNIKPLCSFITPVPGGIGPLTVAHLLVNTLNACEDSLL